MATASGHVPSEGTLDDLELEAIRRSGYAGDDVPDNVRAKIGEIINRWAYVEFQVKVIIREGFNISRPASYSLMHNRDLRALCQTLRFLASTDQWVSEQSLRDDIRKLANKVSEKRVTRNDYAHGVFGRPTKGEHKGQLCRYVFKDDHQKLRPEYKPVRLSDLTSHVNQAKRLGILAQNLTVRLKDWKTKTGRRTPKF